MANNNFGLQTSQQSVFVQALCHAVEQMLLVKGGIYLSRRPEVAEKAIVSFQGRMRVDGLEKFGARTVFSAVKFYTTLERLENDTPCGALIIFVETEHLSRLLLNLEYPSIDEDDDEEVLDACGTLTNLIAGFFVKEVHEEGFLLLQMSHFESFINSSLNGIAFSSEQSVKYEVGFMIQGQKRIVAELTMSDLPRN